MRLFSVSILLVALVAGITARASYEGDSVVRVHYTPETEWWLNRFVSALELDQWASAPGWMDIKTPADVTEGFLARIRSKGLKATVTIEDVQALIDEQMTSIKNHVKSDRAIDSTIYRDFETIQGEIDSLEQDFPDLVSSSVVSSTYEGRDLRVVTVSSGGAGSRQVIWIDCGIHAREWVTQATCMYILDQLTSQYGVDSAITSLIDTYDFQVLPVTNPDGYAYTWDNERLWRKNRVPYGSCYGVDPNRNFDSNFGGQGSSALPCADTYHGPSAFSEAESAAVRDATVALGARLAGFFTIHSYSQYWMTPYGSSSALPADYDEMMRVSAIGVDALEAVHGTRFVYGNIADVIYVASGGSTDWAYDNVGVVYPFALELRDTGTFGFLLPAAQIVPTAEETLAGIVAAIQAFA